MHEMEIITFSEAIKLEKVGYKIWHIMWHPPYRVEKFLDYSHFVVYPGKPWEYESSHFALIEANKDNYISEVRHKIRELRKEGRDAMADIKEEVLEAFINSEELNKE